MISSVRLLADNHTIVIVAGPFLRVLAAPVHEVLQGVCQTAFILPVYYSVLRKIYNINQLFGIIFAVCLKIILHSNAFHDIPCGTGY